MSTSFTREQNWTILNEGDAVNDSQRCQFRRLADKGIEKDLKKLNFPSDIILIADQYYFDATKGDIKRGNFRKGIMFACVFQAYKDLDKHQTPDVLQEIFKISVKHVSKGIKYFHTRLNKELKTDSDYITAEHFIPNIMKSFNVKDKHIEITLELYEKLKNRDSVFNSSNPHSVACGFIYYYFKKNNVNYSTFNFGKEVGLSEVTISKISNKIDELLE